MEENRIGIEHRITTLEERLDAMEKHIDLRLDTLTEGVENVQENAQRHVQWLLALLTASFLITGLTWALRLLGIA